MPYKSIAKPKQIADIGAECRGAAWLEKPGNVAMVGSSPAAFGLFSDRGNSSKVQEISLGQADDVALLDRKVALVRAEDAVWALLDIEHTPKIEQVGRDVRALWWRPGGETALSLGWDGRATEYKVEGHDVATRELPLRGQVAAGALGFDETYVTVEGGEGGGEYRAHPGNTPEPGAKGRAPLPAGAKGLDRVRGSASLGVVFSRGNAKACVITGRAGNRHAKLLHLPAPIHDVAVAETTMIVGTADGRLMLFDGSAIERATPSHIEPTYDSPAPGAGGATALCIAGRGSRTLWIGTGMGEVFMASVVPKG